MPTYNWRCSNQISRCVNKPLVRERPVIEYMCIIISHSTTLSYCSGDVGRPETSHITAAWIVIESFSGRHGKARVVNWFVPSTLATGDSRHRYTVSDAVIMCSPLLFRSTALTKVRSSRKSQSAIGVQFYYPNVTTLRSGLCCRNSVCLSVCLSSVTLVHPTQEVEAFGNISSPLCTLAVLWPPCKILQR